MGKQNSNDLRRRPQIAKQVYDREELDKYGDNSVTDALKGLPATNTA